MASSRATKWIRKWEVLGSKGNIYTVAVKADGRFGCSCPAWKFSRERRECKHIAGLKAGIHESKSSVELVTEPYEQEHGRRPKGFGHWSFTINGKKKMFIGTLKEAKSWLRQKGAEVVVVNP